MDLRPGQGDRAARDGDQAVARRPRQSQQADRQLPVRRADRRRKTELAKQLAAVMGIEFLRFDIPSTWRSTRIALIGAPPGYVGFDQGGQLNRCDQQAPYSVVSARRDREGAPPTIYNILLQVMDPRDPTDNNGRRATSATSS